MITLQDISKQLMKPAKDLADWKFPLSQILEEYYALLEEPCNINFGEAALILQNSTNIYVRRIEHLVNEAEILRQTFFGYEEEGIKKSTNKEKKIFKKSHVDLGNFVMMDLEKDIGKHIDKKNQFQTRKKVKLLSRRFTQLENDTMQLCIPIQVYDILGEIIGKKYDFRCNQAINTNGMLVDELTPYDFTHIYRSYIQEGRNSLSLYSEPKTPGTGTSGYHSITSPNDNESITLVYDEFEDEQNSSLRENDSSLNELQSMEEQNTINNNHESLFVNNSILKEAKTDESEKERTQQSMVQNVNIQNCSIQPVKNMSQTEELSCEIRDSVQVNQIRKSDQNNDENIVQLGASDQIKYDKQINHFCKGSQIFQQNESDNVRWKNGLASMRKRGNQTTKVSICSVDGINEYDWEPMPLIQGIEHVFSSNSSVLKLPDYISFLETKFGSKKRKFTSKLYKPECLAKLILREIELFAKKDTTLCTKQKFKHLQKQEIEDFMKNFDECLNGIERENDDSQYEAVTNVAIDFHVSQNQHDSTENSIEDITSRSYRNSSIEDSIEDITSRSYRNGSIEDSIDYITSRSSSSTDIPLQSTICQNTVDMLAESPNSSNIWRESLTSEINLSYSLPNYQTLIEDKMKKIFEQSNVTTELDQTVAKWHASLQPKLAEAEMRPTFRIHDYSSHIIKALQASEQKKINFDSVVQDKPAREVARYFLASLQLANIYNVEIKAGNSDNDIEIMLLKDRKNYIKN